MSKIILIIMTITMFLTSDNTSYANDKMQGAWITTVYNSDWPKTRGNVSAQKNEMIELLDTLKETGINTVMFQARTQGDALYKSNINPWSSVLTGTQGTDPGYDPLEFVISEAKKRNIEVHVWLNPYRVTTTGTDVTRLHENHQARKNPSWIMSYNDRLYFNPELEPVKEHIVQTVAEIVNNYDIDAIHFDDYFYPSSYPLPSGEDKDGNVANNRRNHITDMVTRVSNKIKELDSSVEFGISPFGVWKNKSNDVNGSNTTARESYYADYADTRKWIQDGLIDYIVPQIYWEIGHSSADYETLVKWWTEQAKGTNVDVYIGHGIYKDTIASEIYNQLKIANKYTNYAGSVYYTTRDIISNRGNSRVQIKQFIDEEKSISLSDIKGHWAENSIRHFIDNGFVNGYADGTFKPDDNITRAEFVKLINKVNNLNYGSNKVFSDTINHWSRHEVDVAYTNKIANGVGDDLFKPDNQITRQEAATMIANYEKIGDNDFDKINRYSDGYQVSNWAKSSVEIAIEKGYLGGYSDNTLRPLNNLTRAEAVTMLLRTIK